MQKFSTKIIGLSFMIIYGFSFLIAGNVYASTTSAGFVPANIWYSTDPFKDGDKIKIYTVIFNPDTRTFTGEVIFFDNTTFLGKKTFSVLGKSTKDEYIDWVVTSGNHSIYAKIENAKFINIDGNSENVYLAQNESAKSERSVAKKILPTPSELKNSFEQTINNTTPSIGVPIENITNTITKNTPEFIIKPLSGVVSSLENFRENLDQKTISKNDEIKKELNLIETNKNNSDKLESKAKDRETPKPLRPFKYLEMFFLTLFSYITHNAWLFYTILLFTLFMILRYIWMKLF